MLIRDLLCHTSGLIPKTDREVPTWDRSELKDVVKSYAAHPLLSEPGETYRYSNAGINTAGRIVEAVSGVPYEDFMQRNLFGPLHMVDTTYLPSPAQLARLAKAYVLDPKSGGLKEVQIGPLKHPLDDPTRHPVPAGCFFSDARDLMQFCRMLLGNGVLDGRRYLTPERIEEMTTKQTPAAIAKPYGFCWDAQGNGVFSHAGAFITLMTIDTRRGYFSIFLIQFGESFTTAEQKHILSEFNRAAKAIAANAL